MTRTLRRVLSTLLVGLGLTGTIAAADDFADFWWVPTESGWGVNISQQGNVIFATIFTYDTNGHSLWLSVAAFKGTGNVFTGDLYRNTGPSYTGAFDPNAVVREKVGTATLNFSDSGTASLTYNVGGVTVTKTISRTTYAPINLTGAYVTNVGSVNTNCLLLNIPDVPDNVPGLTISVNGANIVAGFAGCSLTGTFAQAGSVISASGTTSACYGYAAGTWQIRDLRVIDGVISFHARVDFSAPTSCFLEAQIGGIEF